MTQDMCIPLMWGQRLISIKHTSHLRNHQHKQDIFYYGQAGFSCLCLFQVFPLQLIFHVENLMKNMEKRKNAPSD